MNSESFFLRFANSNKDESLYFKIAFKESELASQLNLTDDGKQIKIHWNKRLNHRCAFLFRSLSLGGKRILTYLENIKKGNRTFIHLLSIASKLNVRNNVKLVYKNASQHFIFKPTDFLHPIKEI